MPDLQLSSPVLVAVAILVFVAVGCGPSQTQSELAPTATPTSATLSTPEPTPELIHVDRSPAALLTINPQPALQSGQVEVSGTGFDPGESIAITSERLPLAKVMADRTGNFDPVTVSLPDQLQSGAHPLHAIGQSSGRDASATLWIRAPRPWLVLDSYDVQQYADFGFVAGGFEPMDQVVASLESKSGDAVQLASLTTDQAGNAAWTQLKLPALAAGTYSIVVRGQANDAEVRRELHITPLKPSIELSPWAGPPGVPVQLNAKGFAPNEHIQAAVGSNPDPTVLQADEYGNLWGAGPIRIPQTAASGAVDLKLTGNESGATSTAQFKVLDPKPWLELTSWSGAPGAPVGFGGGGWIGEEQVDIHIGSASNPTQIVGAADDNGWLKNTSQVYVPLDAGDDVIFVAVGEQSHLVAAATFKVVFPFGLRPAKPSAPTDSVPSPSGRGSA